uniref:NAD(P)H-quinone oxidoreductase subunit 6, chloroplastic n=1 Tax=Cylindrocystis brebissonii TaxID=102167 RepID=A0A191T623_9VIRI|nr:subunit 6 of NADH-plastoquinone oxidoreductase [Cylindrocystis brebissonii]ANI25843.1 subunit 6 of NADH-plastoquinone oxidoreductase [Cylindrocystis brebissonii]
MINFSESTKSILFTFIELSIFLGCLGVVLLPQIIYSALLLAFVFICVALLYLLLNADFLAASQILIYVGAINVLIVFAIMLVSKQDVNISKTKGDYNYLAEFISAASVIAIFSFILNAIFSTSWSSINTTLIKNDQLVLSSSFNTVQKLGFHLLTDFLLPFELLSLLLLVALLGAITIARKQRFFNQ